MAADKKSGGKVTGSDGNKPRPNIGKPENRGVTGGSQGGGGGRRGSGGGRSGGRGSK